MEEEPAIFSVEAAHARFELTRLAGGQNRSPVIEQPRQVLRADRSIPPPATGFLETQARVIAPVLIEEIDIPVRQRSPYQSGERIDHASELVLQWCAPLANDPRTSQRAALGAGRPSYFRIGPGPPWSVRREERLRRQEGGCNPAKSAPT